MEQITILFRSSSLTILLSFLLCLPAAATNILENSVTKERIDYKIHDVQIEQLIDQQVHLPSKLFKIWKTLTETLDFEVGGGIDFNLLRQLERVKMSYGNENSIAFLPDFEISWHTHPATLAKGDLRLLCPPSVEDILIAIVGNYNLWLITSNRLASDFSNTLMLKSYSNLTTRPLTVAVNITADLAGVYIYHAEQNYWQSHWQNKALLQKQLHNLSSQLQNEINKNFIAVAEKKITVTTARENILIGYRAIAHMELKFLSWQQVIQDGVDIKLGIVELLQHQRKIMVD